MFYFENRQIVAPGDLLAEGDYIAGNNTYKEGSKIYASRLGLVEYGERIVQVIALNSVYIPSPGDQVIGKIEDISVNGWIVNINSPYKGILRANDAFNKPFRQQRDNLASLLDVGDLILAKVIAFDRTIDPILTIREPGLGKITQGQIIKVSPAKVPRIIGRKASMINMLKKETDCKITVGRNGIVLVSGPSPENERLAILAIEMISQEAHTSGLTDRVAEMIRREKGVKT
ncbi:MAG: exosome complex RNA-binding protein Rrp4 [Candidatus Bathyarchaeota archaeon]|nr:exosome complex RNA-binding protein Rrp4 [Candidatus Bathyarchaeota archaeon]